MANLREDKFVVDFLQHRDYNTDSAYQDLIQHILSSFRNPPPTQPYNIDYIMTEIQKNTIGLPVYFNPTANLNTTAQLPPTIVRLYQDVSPKRERFEIFYNKLKASVGSVTPIPVEENIPDGDIPELTIILRDLYSKKDVPKRLETTHSYLIGKVLLALKNKINNQAIFATIVKEIKLSKSYIYFLIKFSLLCMNFPKLKTVSRPIRELNCYFKYIKVALQRDVIFWS